MSPSFRAYVTWKAPPTTTSITKNPEITLTTVVMKDSSSTAAPQDRLPANQHAEEPKIADTLTSNGRGGAQSPPTHRVNEESDNSLDSDILPKGVRRLFDTLDRRVARINSRLDNIAARNQRNESSLQAMTQRNHQDRDELQYIAVENGDNGTGLAAIRESVGEMGDKFGEVRGWIVGELGKRKGEGYVFFDSCFWE